MSPRYRILFYLIIVKKGFLVALLMMSTVEYCTHHSQEYSLLFSNYINRTYLESNNYQF